MSQPLQEIHDFSVVDIDDWDIGKWIDKDWCCFPDELKATQLAVEVFALSEDQGFGTPLQTHYAFNSGRQLTKAVFDFRRLGYPEDWLEDNIFYGRGSLPLGCIWLDHARHIIQRVTPPKLKYEDTKAYGATNTCFDEYYIASTQFWYRSVLDTNLPEEDRLRTPCHHSCAICYQQPRSLIPPIANYVIQTTYSLTGDNVAEQHWGLPLHPYRARPNKIWIGGIHFRYVFGRKDQKQPTTRNTGQPTLLPCPSYKRVEETKKPKPKRKASVLLEEKDPEDKNYELVFNIDIEKEFV